MRLSTLRTINSETYRHSSHTLSSFSSLDIHPYSFWLTKLHFREDIFLSSLFLPSIHRVPAFAAAAYTVIIVQDVTNDGSNTEAEALKPFFIWNYNSEHDRQLNSRRFPLMRFDENCL